MPTSMSCLPFASHPWEIWPIPSGRGSRSVGTRFSGAFDGSITASSVEEYGWCGAKARGYMTTG